MALALTRESRFVARLEDVAACSPLMSALVVEARFTIGSNVSEFLSWRHNLNATYRLSPGHARCPRTPGLGGTMRTVGTVLAPVQAQLGAVRSPRSGVSPDQCWAVTLSQHDGGRPTD